MELKADFKEILKTYGRLPQPTMEVYLNGMKENKRLNEDLELKER